MLLLKALKRLSYYPLGELLWMAEAMLWITGARILIRFVPFRFWRHWMGPIGAIPVQKAITPGQHTIALRVQRCVKRMAAHAPLRANCLPQAMAARWMLSRRGVATELHIGAKAVLDDLGGKGVDLHAWVLCGPLCLTGTAQRGLYAPFTRPLPEAGPAS